METQIFDYGMNGEGVGKVDGKIVLVNGSLCGENVEISILEDNKNYAVAKLDKILDESNNRITPICPHFHICGGCALQHMQYSEQLKFKTQLVKKTIKKICNLDCDVNNCVPSQKIQNYRNKMSFSVFHNECGLLKLESKDLVDLENCPLADKTINDVLGVFKKFLSSLENHSIKYLVVRHIENQTLVGVVSTKVENLNSLCSELKEKFSQIGIYQIINTRHDSVVLSGKINHLCGIKDIAISTFGVTYSVDLLGFHQTNLEIQNKIYQKVLDYVSNDSVVINGFSGQGLLSAILATKAKSVVGIEINKSSHLSAEKLKHGNKILNMHNICGDFFEHISHQTNNADTIILDPTKKGCGKEVMNKIRGIENIIYISCNPIALCRDINALKDDYIIENITPFDMFPQTNSVETLVKLKLRRK